MTISRVTRRSLVLGGLAVGLLAGGVALAAASELGSPPATASPAAAAALQSRIALERTRTALLRNQLEDLGSSAEGLARAIEAAQAAADGDHAAAEALQTGLANARARLAEIAASQSQGTPPRRTIVSRVADAAPTAGPVRQEDKADEDDHEGEHEDGHGTTGEHDD
jgi:hypothetical protein